MSVKSGEKGSSYERAKAKELSAWWYTGDPDVIIRGGGSGATPTKRRHSRPWAGAEAAGEYVQIARFDDPFPFSVECKHRKDTATLAGILTRDKHPFWQAWEQCCTACPPDKIPLLLWRTNREKDIAAVPTAVLPESLIQCAGITIRGQHLLAVSCFPLRNFLSIDRATMESVIKWPRATQS